jgi:GNAT superfamily N-acetyltransferase
VNVHNADYRLPLVLEHLRVALRAASGGDLSEQDIIQLSQAEEAPRSSTALQDDAYATSLTFGPAEVVAVYALIPPANPHAFAVSQGLLARWTTEAKKWIYLIGWALPMLQWGLGVPFLLLASIFRIKIALHQSTKTPIYNAAYHDLHTMCVAKHLQGKGIGSAVMKQIMHEAVHEQEAVGLKGLCQSERTRDFYEKQGFRAVEVHAYARGWRGCSTMRRHYFVAWGADRAMM